MQLADFTYCLLALMIMFWSIFSSQPAKQFIFYDCSLCSLECENSLTTTTPCFEQALCSYSKSPIPRDIFVLGSSPSESNTSEKERGRESKQRGGSKPFCPACFIPSLHLLPGCLPDKPAIPRHKLVCPLQLLQKHTHSGECMLYLHCHVFFTSMTYNWVQVGQNRQVKKNV